MAGQPLTGQGKLPNGDGWGAAVHVAPPNGLAKRPGQLGRRLLDPNHADQAAGGPEFSGKVNG
jgi:hypothetical protein